MPKSYIYIPDKGLLTLTLLSQVHRSHTKLRNNLLHLYFSLQVSTQTCSVSIRRLSGHLPRKTGPSQAERHRDGCIYCLVSHQTALLLVVTVVPTLHIVRAGIDENIAFLLLGVGIVLSEDRMEVVQIVTFYTWLLEGSPNYFVSVSTSPQLKVS